MSPEESLAPLLDSASHLLSQRWDTQVSFASVKRLTEEDRHSIVLRLTLDHAPDGAPSSIILKQPNLNSYPEQEREFAFQRFAGDWAGSCYLYGLRTGPRHSPVFYGGDLTRHFILLEDLGEAPTLVTPLLHGDTAEAESALLAFAARLGQMHSDTLGDFSTFEKIAHPLNAPLQPYFYRNLKTLVESVQELCLEWEIPFLDAAQRDLGRIIRVLQEPGLFHSYIHADPCPDNMYFINGSYRLIDFETSGFSHALADAVYFRMSFPTCWCANRIPDEIVEKTESVYRVELAQTCPVVAEDQVFYSALVEMCGFRALVELGYWAKRADESDRDWGIATLRPRVITRLGAFIRAAKQFGHLHGLQELCERVSGVLENRWPGVELLPVYPAFR
jgi:hypothetical protein